MSSWQSGTVGACHHGELVAFTRDYPGRTYYRDVHVLIGKHTPRGVQCKVIIMGRIDVETTEIKMSVPMRGWKPLDKKPKLIYLDPNMRIAWEDPSD